MKYKIKPTKKQLGIMKLYWSMFKAEEDVFFTRMQELERRMSQETGIKDLEFIHDSMCCGWSGIGNGSKTMRLYQQEELE